MNPVMRVGSGLALLSACHGSADQKGDTTQSLEATATYDPGADLTLELSDGATLEVPAGAASEAEEVTFSRVTCDGIYAAPELPSCLYRVESALDFNHRFELTLPRTSEEAGAVVEKADEGMLALLDSASGRAVTAEDLPTTTATASIATDFTVRDTSIAPPDMRCVDLEFTPCGGTMEGSWDLVAACGTMSQVTGSYSTEPPNPYTGCSATDYLLDYPFEVGGKIEFSDGGGDLTTTWSIVWRHQIITEACLESVGLTCGDDGFGGDCTFEDGLCICRMEWSVTTTGSSGSWTAADMEERACVDGDTLTVQREAWGEPYWFVYERR